MSDLPTLNRGAGFAGGTALPGSSLIPEDRFAHVEGVSLRRRREYPEAEVRSRRTALPHSLEAQPPPFDGSEILVDRHRQITS